MEFNAALVPGGSVKVRIKGDKIAGRVVRARNADGEEVLRCRNTDWIMACGEWGDCAIAPTDQEGVTTIGGLRPGNYTISVDGGRNTASVSVKALETAHVELQM